MYQKISVYKRLQMILNNNKRKQLFINRMRYFLCHYFAPSNKSKKMLNQLNFKVMSTLRNKVQLIGNLGNTPEIINLESGKKLAKFSLATNESYKNAKGETIKETQWHNLVAWGKTVDIVSKYLQKGNEVAVEGKLVSRSYDDKNGNKKYVTEIVVNELLMLGGKN